MISNPSLPSTAPLDPIGFFKHQHIKVNICVCFGSQEAVYLWKLCFSCACSILSVSVHVVVVEGVCVCVRACVAFCSAFSVTV